MPTSDATLNAPLESNNPEPLVQALQSFGQFWLTDALGADFEAGGVLTFVPDWTLFYVDPEDAQLDAPTVGAMIAWSVAELGYAPAPPDSPGPGLRATHPLYFRTRQEDLALWGRYTAQAQFTRQDARRLWARRVALSLVIDGVGMVPWRLRGFPAWQVAAMLGWRPEVGNTLADVLSASWRGHSPVLSGAAWHTDDFLWIPDALTAHESALAVVQAAKAATPREALRALRSWMVQRRALHGQQEWSYHWCNDELDAPPGGVHEDDCNPGAANRLSLVQWLRRGWGGCSVNSTALAALLRGVNIPAAMIRPVAIDTQDDQQSITAPPGSWSLSRRVPNSVRYRDVGVAAHDHTTCYAFGAGLACNHGDLNVNGIANGAAFGDDTLSGWLPWRLQTAMHGWAALASAAPASHRGGIATEWAWRWHLAAAILAAADDSLFRASIVPSMAWLLGSTADTTAQNWMALPPPDVPWTLRRWLHAVSLWPCGQPMPGMAGHAALLSSHASSLPRPRWLPLYNLGFAGSTAPMRQALSRSARELLTSMEGVVSTEAVPVARQFYTLRVDGAHMAVDGCVAARVVTLALEARDALEAGAADALERVLLLAAHAYDLIGLSYRAADTPSWAASTWAHTVHARAFPGDREMWFELPDANAVGDTTVTKCEAEGNGIAALAQMYAAGNLAAANPQTLASALVGPDGPVALVTLGKDPLGFEAWPAGSLRACEATESFVPPFDVPEALLAAVGCCVAALLSVAREES